jgi:hypothetical protein
MPPIRPTFPHGAGSGAQIGGGGRIPLLRFVPRLVFDARTGGRITKADEEAHGRNILVHQAQDTADALEFADGGETSFSVFQRVHRAASLADFGLRSGGRTPRLPTADQGRLAARRSGGQPLGRCLMRPQASPAEAVLRKYLVMLNSRFQYSERAEFFRRCQVIDGASDLPVRPKSSKSAFLSSLVLRSQTVAKDYSIVLFLFITQTPARLLGGRACRFEVCFRHRNDRS